MILRNIQYDFSSAAYLLFFLPLLVALFWILFTYRKNATKHLSKPSYHQQLLIQRHPPYYWNKVLLFSLAWICAVLAFMQPKGNERYPQHTGNKLEGLQKGTLKRKAHDVILLIDASASMAVNDTPSGSSRLDYAKEIADQLVSNLSGENVAVLAVTSQTLTLSPSTLDYLFARLMIKEMQINEGDTEGTDILQALQHVSKDYFQEAPTKLKTLILLSDGGDTNLESLSGSAKEKRLTDILNTVSDSQAKNFRVYTVGMGSKAGKTVPHVTYQGQPVTSALNEDLLKRLSIRGRGQYSMSNELNSVQIAQNIIESMAQDNPYIDEKEAAKYAHEGNPVYDLYFQFPLGIALICLSLVLILPEVSRPAIVPVILLCFIWSPLVTADQERDAQIYYEARDYDQALQIYREMLAESPASEKKAVIDYNIGTLLLMKEQWNEALLQFQNASYDSTLSPLLAMRLHLNLADAAYQVASRSKDDEKSIYFFQQAQEELEQAQKAACVLAEVEGQELCISDPEITAKQKEVSQKLEELVGSNFEKSTPEQQAAILVMKHMILKAVKSFAVDDAESTLKSALNDQEFALRLEFMRRNLSRVSPEIDQIVKNAQAAVIKQAEPFLDQVYEQQKKDFHEKKESCQKSPWDEVIPLYNQGLQTAQEANQGHLMMQNQEKTIKFWSDALERWHHPRKEPEKEKKPPTPEQTANLNQALTELQEMEQDDKSKPAFKSQGAKQVERPW